MAAEDRPVHEFRVPERRVNDAADLETWKKSQAYQDFTGFIYILNEAVKGKKNNDSVTTAPRSYDEFIVCGRGSYLFHICSVLTMSS
jgi:hypothetical protein